jgi:hypothetical protein
VTLRLVSSVTLTHIHCAAHIDELFIVGGWTNMGLGDDVNILRFDADGGDGYTVRRPMVRHARIHTRTSMHTLHFFACSPAVRDAAATACVSCLRAAAGGRAEHVASLWAQRDGVRPWARVAPRVWRHAAGRLLGRAE